MSERENFLARWSRRKQEVAEREAQAEETPVPAELPEPRQEAALRPAPAEHPEAEGEQKFDPASLPALDTIGPGTDIREFLRKGVPAELTRAALRRAWSADPTIRDFVGLAENAWDFNAPDTIPGFGPLLSGADVHKIMTQLLGDKSPLATPREEMCTAAETEQLPPASAALPIPQVAEPPVDVGGDKEAPQNLTLAQGPAALAGLHASSEASAAQNEPDVGKATNDLPRRHHGGALPE